MTPTSLKQAVSSIVAVVAVSLGGCEGNKTASTQHPNVKLKTEVRKLPNGEEEIVTTDMSRR